MLEASEHIYSTLDLPAINAVVTNGVFWGLAPEKTVAPFITFTFTAGPPVTKDGPRDHQVKIRIYAESLTQGATIAGTIQSELKTGSRWKDKGYVSDYADPEALEAFVELIYEFKY